jgi:hypothetical protein
VVKRGGVVSRFKRLPLTTAHHKDTGRSAPAVKGGAPTPAALERLSKSLQKVTTKPRAKYTHF